MELWLSVLNSLPTRRIMMESSKKNLQNNSYLAHFMGCKLEQVTGSNEIAFFGDFPGGGYYFPERLKYNESWNWLMPVVEKIRTIQLPTPSMIPVGVTIDNYECRIDDGCRQLNNIIQVNYGDEYDIKTCKEAVYQAVCDFNYWYRFKQK